MLLSYHRVSITKIRPFRKSPLPSYRIVVLLSFPSRTIRHFYWESEREIRKSSSTRHAAWYPVVQTPLITPPACLSSLPYAWHFHFSSYRIPWQHFIVEKTKTLTSLGSAGFLDQFIPFGLFFRQGLDALRARIKHHVSSERTDKDFTLNATSMFVWVGTIQRIQTNNVLRMREVSVRGSPSRLGQMVIQIDASVTSFVSAFFLGSAS